MKYEKILFATTNPAKIRRVKNILQKSRLTILTLSDLSYEIPAPIENQNSPMRIAEEKAIHYWKKLRLKYPVLTQDDTIQFDNVEEADKPSMSIKDPVIKKYGKFSDNLALNYYITLANKYGGQISTTFSYGFALYDGKKLKSKGAKLNCRLINAVSEKLMADYFFASISQVNLHGRWKYYSELTEHELRGVDHALSNTLYSLLNNQSN